MIFLTAGPFSGSVNMTKTGVDTAPYTRYSQEPRREAPYSFYCVFCSCEPTETTYNKNLQ